MRSPGPAAPSSTRPRAFRASQSARSAGRRRSSGRAKTSGRLRSRTCWWPTAPAAASSVATVALLLLVGLAAGPLLVGVLADGFEMRFGNDALRYSLLVPTCAPLLSSLVCFIGARRVAGDLERARASDG